MVVSKYIIECCKYAFHLQLKYNSVTLPMKSVQIRFFELPLCANTASESHCMIGQRGSKSAAVAFGCCSGLKYKDRGKFLKHKDTS